ncbi:DUF2523 family protein [Vibrio casei]|uniref:DUF2523 family protein n=1 Tax=Vibrio casei TaxID=673372 RepID=UPI000EB653E4|nr:MAG: protein of unknown function DUF2523 [Inoviridae sp.]|tara:strand:+ start:4524 stop:4835 length:312 start_codon:yes stop_codon:yes gene_type:complete
MPLLLQTFFVSLAALLPSLVSKVLVGLGFGYVTYELGQFGIDYVYQLIAANASGLPVEIIAVLKYAKLDIAVGIMLGSYAAALTIRGLTSAGSVTKLGVRSAP